MYEQIRSLPTKDQVEQITERLVGINSINGTYGEIEVVEEIYQILRGFPYFQKHPSHVWLQKVPQDPLGRVNLFAYVGGHTQSKKTILYHAHIDTVGIEDFGFLKEQAFSPGSLLHYYRSYASREEVRGDAQSGNWMFGRGALDMKSGAAVHIANVLYFSEHQEELPGNILLVINGDEESEHRGITSALSELQRLKEGRNLEYVLAINTDFVTPLYDGDQQKYIYTGTAGKLLPSFSIFGREVHVGDTLAGIDPNYIAAKLTERLHNNYQLTEKIPGEQVLPPTCLQQRDTKERYTVQTAASSRLYFNYFIYESTPEDVLSLLVKETEKICEHVEQYFQQQYNHYSMITSLPERKLSWNIEVSTYEQYVKELEKRGIETRSIIESVLDENPRLELRELCFLIVRALREADTREQARVILFFAPPFLPHNFLKNDNDRDRQIQMSLTSILAEMEAETGEIFSVKKFFPYLADGSFLSIHETEEQLSSLLDNMPEWEQLYRIPFDAIRQFDIPSINMGVYGKDGHKWSERVYKPYSFVTLPELIRKTTKRFLNERQNIDSPFISK
ncbi:M20/M25/M40 family metallo-hydrolase [Halobacillus shinanisalinarum]|uniref:M20/M25/M40 family metallo-hydrolase n=1 Tax=Halobacillus shinanisalinarum TaxID=2932258 RepID=A0ABY4GW10_9BACI|nr:M20/M25/M40 family metallo-hydrolase [Halobacillus shinanisalinarum]UOQ92352.1 M20/M25/M40 family metallo-hydrolase [Halobacillus shinanisalinarum]